MSDAGYVRLYRRLLGHPAFRNDAEAMTFAWMILRAAWKPHRVRYKGYDITLDRGDLTISVRDLAAAMDRQKGWVERLLQRLREHAMITQKSPKNDRTPVGTRVGTHGGTSSGTPPSIITICNYDEYQAEIDGNGTGSKTLRKTRTGQRQDTEQRREEGKKLEEETDVSPSTPARRARRTIRTAGEDRPLPFDWQPTIGPAAQRIVDGWPPGMLGREELAFRSHAEANGRLAKNWDAAFGMWITKAEERRLENANRYRPHPDRDDQQYSDPFVQAALERQARRAAGERR